MNIEIIYTLSGCALALVWALALFILGQSRKSRDLWFYTLLYVPGVLGLIYAATTTAATISTASLVLLLVLIIERIAWGLTAREASGEDQLVWFLIIIFVPVFGWLLYRATKLG